MELVAAFAGRGVAEGRDVEVLLFCRHVERGPVGLRLRERACLVAPPPLQLSSLFVLLQSHQLLSPELAQVS